MMEVNLRTNLSVPVKQIVDSMDHDDLVKFIEVVAHTLDRDFHTRKEAAEVFSSGLSETGCRFLAEVIASHCMRFKRSLNKPHE